MPFPQFAVMVYLACYLVFEIVTVTLVFSGFIDIRGGRYKPRRDFLEAALYRLASKGTLTILLVAGDFW